MSCCIALLAAFQTKAQVAPDDHFDRAIIAAQETTNHAISRAFANLGAEVVANDPELSGLLDQRQSAIVELSDLRTIQYRVLTGVQQGDLETIATSISNQISIVEGLEAQLEGQAPDVFSLLSPMPIHPDELRASLSPDEAVLMIVPFAQRTYTFLVTAEKDYWTRSELGNSEVSTLVSSVRRGLNKTRLDAFSGNTGPSYYFDHDASYTLYQELIEPLEGALEGKKHLLVVTSRAMSALPLAVLQIEPSAEVAQFSEIEWFGTKYAISVLPSLDAIRIIRTSGWRPRSAQRSFLGIGAPALLGRENDGSTNSAIDAVQTSLASQMTSAYAGGEPSIDRISVLEPLPHTEDEIRQLGQLLGQGNAMILLQEQASEADLRAARPEEFRILAFATHGLIAGELDGVAEPALVLTPPLSDEGSKNDGLLVASEIAGLRLAADWVILSACNTAAGDRPGAEGLSGLASAFLYAGARSLLVSHWPVSDEYAEVITVGLLKTIQANPGIGRAEAMRLTMLALVKNESDSALSDPLVWAPFMLVGDGAAVYSID